MIGRLLGAGLKAGLRLGGRGALGVAKGTGKATIRAGKGVLNATPQFGGGLVGHTPKAGSRTLGGAIGRGLGKTTRAGAEGAGAFVEGTGKVLQGAGRIADRTILRQTPRSIWNPIGRELKPGAQAVIGGGAVLGAGAMGFMNYENQGNLGAVEPGMNTPQSMGFDGREPQRPRHPQDMGATGDLVFALHNQR